MSVLAPVAGFDRDHTMMKTSRIAAGLLMAEGRRFDEAYWQDSPLREIWKVGTPMLIIAGEADVRVPAPLAD